MKVARIRLGKTKYKRKMFHLDHYRLSEHLFKEIVKSKNVNYWPAENFSKVVKKMRHFNRQQFSSEVWFRKKLHEKDIVSYLQNWPILNRFYADFYFPTRNLVIEIDGTGHHSTKELDKGRDALMRKVGINTIRIKSLNEIHATQILNWLSADDNLKFDFILNKKRKLKTWEPPILKREAFKPLVTFETNSPKYITRKKMV